MGVVISTSFSVCFYSGSQDDVCVCIERGDLLIFIPGLIQTSEKTISEKWKECRDGKYKHREKRGELCICRSHHKFSTRPKRRGCKVGGRVGVIYIYKAHLFSPDACTCHPYIPSIFPKWFFHLFMLLFLLIYHMKYQPGLNHRKMRRPLFKYTV